MFCEFKSAFLKLKTLFHNLTPRNFFTNTTFKL